MTVSAPRLGPRLLEVVARADDGRRPIAEICRRVGDAADELGVKRPSYEQVRVHVHALRAARSRPSAAEVAVDVLFRARPPDALLDHVVGEPLRPRRA